MSAIFPRIAILVGLGMVLTVLGSAATSAWDIYPAHVRRHSRARPGRDLRSDHFFDETKYPTITFKSKKVERSGANATSPVNDPWRNQRLAATGGTKINRQDFGVKGNATMDNDGAVVGGEISINIDVEATKTGHSRSNEGVGTTGEYYSRGSIAK